MAIAVLCEWSGVRQAQLDQLVAALEWEASLAEEKIVYRGEGHLGSLAYLDAWESQAAFDRFYGEQLIPALREAGLPQPGMTSWRLPDLGKNCADVPEPGPDCLDRLTRMRLFTEFGPALDARFLPGAGGGENN